MKIYIGIMLFIWMLGWVLGWMFTAGIILAENGCEMNASISVFLAMLFWPIFLGIYYGQVRYTGRIK